MRGKKKSDMVKTGSGNKGSYTTTLNPEPGKEQSSFPGGLHPDGTAPSLCTAQQEGGSGSRSQTPGPLETGSRGRPRKLGWAAPEGAANERVLESDWPP